MTQDDPLNSISVSFTSDSNDDESNQDASRVLRKLLPGATKVSTILQFHWITCIRQTVRFRKKSSINSLPHRQKWN